MLFTIIVILIIGLVILAIIINAIQQHKEEQEAIKRREMKRVNHVIDETETIMMASSHLPTPNVVVSILNGRIVSALKVLKKLNPKAYSIDQRIADAQAKAEISGEAVPAEPPNFALPEQEKTIMQYIHTAKKLRMVLRSEQNKGRVPGAIASALDSYYEKLLLRINIETLYKRGLKAKETNMLGSARQYFEKCQKALAAVPEQDNYTEQKDEQVKEQLNQIQQMLRAEQEAANGGPAREEDEQFATKTKW
jgi:cation transport regulator ChaC